MKQGNGAQGALPQAALVGWRLLALLYDALPVLALWLLVSALFTAVFTLLGHRAEDDNIRPFSWLAWVLWIACWLVTAAYALASWRKGGQTLGMRPWRLRVVAADGGPAPWRGLWLRFLVGHASLLLAGLGFWWAWFDRDRLAWHDRASGTRLLRLPKRAEARIGGREP